MRLLLICICLLSVVLCARPINDGNKLFKKGDYAGALEKYMKAREAEPANPLLFYNIGTCQYKLGNYDEAKKELESAVRMPDKKMAAKAAYNLANTHFRIGEKSSEGSERIAAWRESVAYLKKAIDLDNGFENAKKNVEIVQRKLKEELDKQKQNQEQNQDQDKDQKCRQEFSCATDACQKAKLHYPTTFLTASSTRSAWNGLTIKSLAPA